MTTRRHFLQTVSAGSLVALAGCSALNSTDDEPTDDTATPTPTDTQTEDDNETTTEPETPTWEERDLTAPEVSHTQDEETLTITVNDFGDANQVYIITPDAEHTSFKGDGSASERNPDAWVLDAPGTVTVTGGGEPFVVILQGAYPDDYRHSISDPIRVSSN